MKAFYLLLFIFSSFSFAENIIVNGTRFIYLGNEKEITIQLTNLANRPAIAQVWLDEGDANATPDTISTPFQIIPPISRIDPKGGQTLRIRLTDKKSLPANRESLFWLNVLDIPPLMKSEQNRDKTILQLAIRSRFKFFYRPEKLNGRESASEQLILTVIGDHLIINNPTPFYLTLTGIFRHERASLLNTVVILAPNSQETVQLKQHVNKGENLTITLINDYGTDNTTKITIQ